MRLPITIAAFLTLAFFLGGCWGVAGQPPAPPNGQIPATTTDAIDTTTTTAGRQYPSETSIEGKTALRYTAEGKKVYNNPELRLYFEYPRGWVVNKNEILQVEQLEKKYAKLQVMNLNPRKIINIHLQSHSSYFEEAGGVPFQNIAPANIAEGLGTFIEAVDLPYYCAPEPFRENGFSSRYFDQLGKVYLNRITFLQRDTEPWSNLFIIMNELVIDEEDLGLKINSKSDFKKLQPCNPVIDAKFKQDEETLQAYNIVISSLIF